MIRVLVADDEHLIREALVALLELTDDIEVVGQAASGDEALTLGLRLAPDVAVLDLQMPGLSGTEVAAELAERLPGCVCVIVTSHGLPGHLKHALAGGVRGFVPKTVTGARLAEVIRTVHSGARYVDPGLAADAIAAGDSPLTPREADVLQAAEGGAPVEEIAVRVHLSSGTVRNYLSSAIGKLHAATRHEAVRIARERGWI
ncbi:response regulator transcription factor [Micropruina sonneratiae]|uniref:response regulator transcription factor n=1 Tax=Micropruina sonneratiae TaxID=2986940 RepID=UPI0022267B49|nr:response regulator transcription factor [Micropruina sp. KQZ13P-5]MCW3158218.1 response regulator transcription factor [Micropruina sp. KQZ13P-5]